MTALDQREVLDNLRREALYINTAGEVFGIRDAGLANQVWEIERGLGVPWLRHDGQWSAWLSEPEFILRLTQPDTWQACWRLYSADCADRALDLYGGKVDPRSRQAVRVARLYAHGRATDEEMKAACKAAFDAARAAWSAAWSAAKSAAWSVASRSAVDAVDVAARSAEAAAECAGVDRAAERRAQWQRLLQYVDNGIKAEHMPWPDRVGTLDGEMD